MRTSRAVKFSLGFLFLAAIVATPAYMRAKFPVASNQNRATPANEGSYLRYETLLVNNHLLMSPNQPPIAVDDTLIVHGVTGLSPLLQNDSDPDGGPLFLGGFPTSPQHGQIAFGSYHPDSAYTGADSFSYEVCDNQGACDTGNVAVDVRNETPNAQDDSYQIHGSTLVGPLLANDTDSDNDALSLTQLITSPQHGNLFNTAAPDIFTFVPAYEFTGQDSFIYKVCDNLGACDTASVLLTVTNAPPTPLAKSYLIRGNTLVGPLLAGDTDPEGDNLTLTTLVTSPAHGGLFNTGGVNIFEFRPDVGFTGSDSFIYRVCDSLGACSNSTVTLYIVGDGENIGACSPCSSGAMAVGGPINVTNGNMYLQQRDYSLPGAGRRIDITRTYNSASQLVGLFGRGWSSEYDESVAAFDNNLARFTQSDGRVVYLGRAVGSSGVFTSLVGDFHGSLAQSSRGGGFTLTMIDGGVRQFNASGKLVSLADRVGNETTLAYDGSGKLTSVTDPFGRVLSFTTNANGRVLSIADTLGTVATYTYGSSNELLSVTYADSSAFQFTYDGNLRLLSVTDALSNVVEAHTYDSQGRAITSERQGGVEHYGLSYVSNTRTDVTDALGHVTKYTIDKSKGRFVVTQVEALCSCGGGVSSLVQTWTYDSQLNLTAQTDALNHTITFTHDSNGNRLTETDATGTVTYTFNAFGQVLTRTNQLSGVRTNTYDTQGNPLTTKDALNNTTTFTHDSHGHLLTATNALGKVTTYTWDSSGRMTQGKNALDHTTDVAYDARARVTAVTNALNETTSYEYDAAGRLQQITFPDSSFVSNTYDLAGRRTNVTDARGNDTTLAYDSAYRLISVTDALSQTTSIGYDNMSNRISLTDALGRVTNYEYDDFNRLKKVIAPPATIGATRLQEITEYDAGGNVKKKIDIAGRETTFVYDSVDRLTSSTDADNKTTSYQYDTLSRTTAVIDALAQTYGFAYDAVGRETGMTRGGDAMSFAYDAVGNRTARTDYNGVTTGYSYDDLNRLTAITYPNSTGVAYTYDALSRLATAANENGTVSFTYDDRGRIASTTDVFNQTLVYTYDANGNRTAMNLAGSDYAGYSYDVLNRLTELSDRRDVVATYEYDAVSQPTSRTLTNGVVSTYDHDGLNRLTRLHDVAGTSPVFDNQYAYNAAQQISEIVELGGTKEYGYDVIDRLTSATGEGYEYDSVGNRTTNGDYTYGAVNRLTAFGSLNYSYDDNGNQLTRGMGSAGATRTYDFENRLIQVDLVGSLGPHPHVRTIAYKYDALGRRIERSDSDGDLQKFVYDGEDVVQDLDQSESVVASYINGPGIDNKIRQTDANGNLYFTSDHLGSTRTLTDDSGNVVEQLDYDSFGNLTAGGSYTRYTYTGREFDPVTELYYYRARFYDPQVGRFISEDPIGLAGGINAFAYASNNPISHKDPTGLADIDVHYYLTYYLAMATGCFKDWEARAIAEGDQRSDEDNDKKPALGLKPSASAPMGRGVGATADEDQQRRNRDFHAFGTAEQNAARLGELRNAAGTTDLFGFGTYLHFLQDFSTHRASRGNITWGQLMSGGHQVDHTTFDPGAAMFSARVVFDELKELARKRGCTCTGEPDWNRVRAFMDVGYSPGDSRIVTLGLSNQHLRQKIGILNVPWRSPTGR